MGHESDNGPFVAYIDGQPAEIGQPVTELTLDYSEAGAAEAMENMATAMAGVSFTMEIAAEGIQKFFRAAELSVAILLAQKFEPELARRYLHTKKKRIRKKYEKRILAWFREMFL